VTGPGRLIYTSGLQGRDKDGKLAPDIRAQSVQVLENIKNALAAVGATFDHVIKFNVYMLDLEKSLPGFSEIKRQYVNTSAPPPPTRCVSYCGLSPNPSHSIRQPRHYPASLPTSPGRPAPQARPAAPTVGCRSREGPPISKPT